MQFMIRFICQLWKSKVPLDQEVRAVAVNNTGGQQYAM